MTETQSPVFAIVNPTASSGKTRTWWPQAYECLIAAGLTVDFVYTEAPLHAIDLAKEAGEKGYPVVMYVGGDGTANEVANGLLRLPRDIRPAMAALPWGSGADFPRGLGIRPGVQKAIERLRTPRPFKIDVVTSRFFGFDGSRVERAFINVADAGLGGHVTERVNRSSKPLGGTVAFLWAIVSSFWRYQNLPMTISVDRQVVYEGPVATAIVANCTHFGGGVKIAPHACPDDGLLEVVLVRDITKLDLISQLANIYRGTHVRHPKVSLFRGTEVTVTSPCPLPLDLDGEFPGYGPLHCRIEPAELTVLV